MGAAPLNPGQPLTIRTQGRRSVEVRTFGQQMALTICQADRDQAMLIGLLLHRQHLTVSEVKIAITTLT